MNSVQLADLYASMMGEYLVWDTGIEDHANAATKYSIAWSIAQATAAGGGVIRLGQGTFNLTSTRLVAQNHISIIGSGRASTVINQQSAAHDGLFVEGLNTERHDGLFQSFRIAMPTNAQSMKAGMRFTLNYAQVRDVAVTGGSSVSWCYILDNFYNLHMDNCFFGGTGVASYDDVDANGMLCHNSLVDANPGDSVINALHGRIKGGATALHLSSDINSVQTSPCNNMTFIGLWVTSRAGTAEAGKGVVLESKATRNSFINCDTENMGYGWDISADSIENEFLNCTASAHSQDEWVDASAQDANVYLGGNSTLLAFENIARVP